MRGGRRLRSPEAWGPGRSEREAAGAGRDQAVRGRRDLGGRDVFPLVSASPVFEPRRSLPSPLRLLLQWIQVCGSFLPPVPAFLLSPLVMATSRRVLLAIALLAVLAASAAAEKRGPKITSKARWVVFAPFRVEISERMAVGEATGARWVCGRPEGGGG